MRLSRWWRGWPASAALLHSVTISVEQLSPHLSETSALLPALLD